MELRTERLVLRRWSAADRPAFRELNADPVVMATIGPLLSSDQSDAMLDRIEASRDRQGFGLWCVTVGGVPIGWTGLSIPAFRPDEIEIGWSERSDFWGNGYVTEAALAVIDDAFGRLELDRLSRSRPRSIAGLVRSCSASAWRTTLTAISTTPVFQPAARSGGTCSTGLIARATKPSATASAGRVEVVSKLVMLLHGPNLNLLGDREPKVYGSATLADYEVACVAHAEALGLVVEAHQSNHEGELIDLIHGARQRCAGIVINPGAFTHYAWAIHDALAAFEGPVVEVHISNPNAREAWRHTSVVAPVATGTISGFGQQGYRFALEAIAERLSV